MLKKKDGVWWKRGKNLGELNHVKKLERKIRETLCGLIESLVVECLSEKLRGRQLKGT